MKLAAAGYAQRKRELAYANFGDRWPPASFRHRSATLTLPPARLATCAHCTDALVGNSDRILRFYRRVDA